MPAAAVGLARRAWRSLPVGARRALADRRPRLVTAGDEPAAKDAAAAAGVPVARTLRVGTDVRGLVDADLGAHWVLEPNHRSGGLVHLGHGVPDRGARSRRRRRRRAVGWTGHRRAADGGGAARGPPCPARRGAARDPAVDLADWKVHVIGGEPVLVQVHTGRSGDHRVRWYRPDRTPTDVTVAATRSVDPVPPPAALPRSPRRGGWRRGGTTSAWTSASSPTGPVPTGSSSAS